MGIAKLLKSGAGAKDYARMFGLDKYEEGTIIYASNTSAKNLWINHELGVTPTFLLCKPKNVENYDWNTTAHGSFPNLYTFNFMAFLSNAKHIATYLGVEKGIVSSDKNVEFTLQQTYAKTLETNEPYGAVSLTEISWKWNYGMNDSYYSSFKGGVEYEYIVGV